MAPAFFFAGRKTADAWLILATAAKLWPSAHAKETVGKLCRKLKKCPERAKNGLVACLLTVSYVIFQQVMFTGIRYRLDVTLIFLLFGTATE